VLAEDMERRASVEQQKLNNSGSALQQTKLKITGPDPIYKNPGYDKFDKRTYNVRTYHINVHDIYYIYCIRRLFMHNLGTFVL
jgi:hypothetical protein